MHDSVRGPRACWLAVVAGAGAGEGDTLLVDSTPPPPQAASKAATNRTDDRFMNRFPASASNRRRLSPVIDRLSVRKVTVSPAMAGSDRGLPPIALAARGRPHALRSIPEAHRERCYRMKLNAHLLISPSFRLIQRVGGDGSAPSVCVLGVRSTPSCRSELQKAAWVQGRNAAVRALMTVSRLTS